MAAKRSSRARGSKKAAGGDSRREPSTARGALLLFALVLLAYANSLPNEFVFDDHTLVDFNPEVNPASATAIEHREILYRPLRTQSYVLDRMIGGHHPASYRLGNMVYHAITGWIALMAYRQLGMTPASALLGAALFVVHPVQTESVAYVSGRRDVLCGLFVLLAFHLYLRWRSDKGRPWHAMASVLAWLAGILTKETAYVLPLLVVAHDLTVSRAQQQLAMGSRGVLSASVALFRRQLPVYAALGLLTLIGTGYLLYRGWPTGQGWWGGTSVTNFLNVALLWVHSVVLMILPLRLLADYSFEAVPLITTVVSPLAWAAVVALLCLFASSCCMTRRAPVAVFLLWWAGLTLLPSSHVVPHHDFFAEHYLYLPLFGFAGFLSLALFRVGSHLGLTRRHVEIIGLMLVLLYGARTVIRNRDWRDNLTLWRTTSTAAPRCARARGNYGGALLAQHETDRAEEEFQAAIAIDPRQRAARTGMIMIDHARGRLDERDRRLRMARGNLPYTNLLSLAGWFLINREYELAIDLARDAARLRRSPARAWVIEGWARARSGQVDLACPLFEKALAHAPNSPEARAGLELCRQRGQSQRRSNR